MNNPMPYKTKPPSQVLGTAFVFTAAVALPTPTRATINDIGPDLAELNNKVNCSCHKF